MEILTLDDIHTWLLIVVFAYGSMVVSWRQAKASGWHDLAQRFHFTGKFRGKRWYFQSASMREAKYGNCLIFGAGPEGLYMEPIPLMSFAHQPLLIPWDEIRVEPMEIRFVPFYRLRIQQFPFLFFRINARLYRRLESFLKPLEATGSPRRQAAVQVELGGDALHGDEHVADVLP